MRTIAERARLLRPSDYAQHVGARTAGEPGRVIARRPQADVAISGSEIATVAARLRNDRFCANEGGRSQLSQIRDWQTDWGYIDSDPWLDVGARTAGES